MTVQRVACGNAVMTWTSHLSKLVVVLMMPLMLVLVYCQLFGGDTRFYQTGNVGLQKALFPRDCRKTAKGHPSPSLCPRVEFYPRQRVCEYGGRDIVSLPILPMLLCT